MSKLFTIFRFVLLMVLAGFAAQTDFAAPTDSRHGSPGFFLGLLGIIFYIAFDTLSRLIAYRRLVSRLGVAHEIWANADRFSNLPFLRWSPFPTWALHFWWKPGCLAILWRGLFCSLRSWWVWQCIYEVVVATSLVLGITYFLTPDLYTWSAAPYGFAAVVILASKRALTIYKPEKFCPNY